MRRSFTIVSIVSHTIVVGALCIAQLLAVGELPTPRTPLTFSGAMPVRVIDIPLPPPRPRLSPGRGANAAAPDGAPAAPVVSPDTIAPETAPDRPGSPVGAPIGEIGITSNTGFGTVVAVHAPPPPPPPATPIRLGGGMQAPRKIVHVDPVYPRVAQQARVEGTVILETVIDVNGHVTSVAVLRSIPLLDQAAVDAVRGWTFTPTLLNGVPVPIALTVTVRFALSGR
jgi:periplasmic protein TonB